MIGNQFNSGNSNGGEIIKQMVGNAIFMTGVIANAWFIETRGEYLIPEEDYFPLVEQFQHRLVKRLMPAKTLEDIRAEAAKFVAEVYAKAREANGTANDSSPDIKSEEAGDTGEV
jgi:hypothetical protein